MPRDLGALTASLPAQLTSFIGREMQLSELVRLLSATSTTRLITLTGMGGVGKTRLALEVAAALPASVFPHGVYLVELAPVVDPARLAHAIATPLGLAEESGRTRSEMLLDALRTRQLLLVLDNCEHLVQVCAQTAYAILRGCAGVSILATSREPLGLVGESVVFVPPLQRPVLALAHSADELQRYPAVQLFTERAQAVCPTFTIDDATASAVARICDHLDGIPLALELAAARVRALSVEQLAQRLDDRFRLLGTGNRGAPARQQTLEAALSWSYDLLDESEQRVFARLAVFAGGWVLEAAEAVCADDEIDRTRVFDVLSRLVDKSLVVADDGPDRQKWFRFLETVREFAARRLRMSGDEQAVRTRHFNWYVRFAEASDQALRLSHQPWSARVEWIARLHVEHDNLRQAWLWASSGQGDIEAGLRLAAGLFPFQYLRGYVSDGRALLADLLERDSANEPSPGRAKALAAAAKLAAHFGADADARVHAAAYLQLPATDRDPSSEGLVHNALGIVGIHEGDLVGAREHVSMAIRLSHEVREGAASIYLSYLGAIAATKGDLDEAEHVYEACLDEARADDFQLSIGLALQGLASIARLRGNASRARALYEEAIHTLAATPSMPQMVSMLVAVGDLALERHDATTAQRRFAEALQCAEGLGHRQALSTVLVGSARLVLSNEQTGRARLMDAVRAFGAASAFWASAGQGRWLENARRRLGRGRVDTLLQEGQALPIDSAVVLARSLVSEGHGAVGRYSERASTLTPREREVARLLARGWSNRQIAEALVLGERTVEMHVSHILTKLGLSSRSQVAVWATRNADAQQALASR